MQIHELNNYNGDLDSAAYLAVDNGNDTGKVSATRLLSGVTGAISELDVSLNERIDNIIAGDPAPSAEEITDARLGANGYAYPSLGDAIRDQVSDLQSEFDYLEMGEKYYPYVIVPNSYVMADGSFASYAGWSRTDYIRVEEGDTIYVNNPTRSDYSAWYKEDKTLLSRLVLPPGNPAEITVPTGAYYVAISNPSSSMFTKMWSDSQLVDKSLTISGKAADAKSTGDAIDDVRGAISDLENLDAEMIDVFTISDFSKGAVTDDTTFINPSQTTSNQFKYIKFTDFIEGDIQPYITVDVGANHLLAYMNLFDESNHSVWSNNAWQELTSGTFNYLKKSVADAFGAKTLTITFVVSTSLAVADRIDIPNTTGFTGYYLGYSNLVNHIRALENGTGNTFIVGGNSDYQTIQSAIDASQDGDTIVIQPGIYNEAVEMWGKNRHLVGVDRDSCIIYNGSGLYDTPPLEANIGSISNLTIISGNDNGLTEDSAIAKAYGIHVEYANAEEYTLNIKNCIIKSALHSAIGMGVRYNQHVNIIDCYIETESEITYSYATESFIHSAPILFHNDASGSNNGGNGSLHISKCELVGKNTVVMARSMENGNNLTVRFDRNLGYYTDPTGQIVDYWGSNPPSDPDHFVGTDVYFDKHSFGNNADSLNYSA